MGWRVRPIYTSLSPLEIREIERESEQAREREGDTERERRKRARPPV